MAAGLTFTVNGSSFGVLSRNSGTYALAIIIKPPDIDLVPFHVKGANGSYTVGGSPTNFKQQEIIVRVAFVGSLNDVYDDWESFKSSWAGNPIAIADPAGNTYNRCFLQPSGGIIKGPQGIGDGLCRMDCEFLFLSFGGAAS